MAKLRFENAEQWQTKREIDRINRQIKQAFTKFGADSRLAMQYTTILQGSENRMLEGSIAKTRALNLRTGQTEPILRYTKDGIPQISTGKATLREFSTISQMQGMLKNLGRMQTVQTAQRQMIAAYEERTGKKVIGREQQKQAIYEELKEYRESENFREKYLNPLYAYEDKMGVSLQALNEIRQKSKGRWTSKAEYQELVDIATRAEMEIKAGRARIVEDAFSQNQW